MRKAGDTAASIKALKEAVAPTVRKQILEDMMVGQGEGLFSFRGVYGEGKGFIPIIVIYTGRYIGTAPVNMAGTRCRR